MDIGDIKVDIENRKVDVQDKKVDIEQYLVLEKENVNLKGISILTVCIPLITIIIAEVVNEIMKETSTLSLDCSGSILLGMMFVVLSIVCRYGAETLKK